MLVECIPHPDIYQKDFSNDKCYCSCLYFFLDMILKNGIILIDSDNKYIDAINNNLDMWPKDDRKKRIQDKLKELKKADRFIKVDSKSIEVNAECCKKNCNIFYSILNNRKIGTIIPEWCENTPKEKYKISEFTDSSLYEDLNTLSAFFDKGQELQFKSEILIPILKYAKSIKIVDRVFADHIDNVNFSIKEEYKNGLENLIKIVKQNNGNKKVIVELYVAFNQLNKTSMHNAILKKKISAVEDFICELNKKYEIVIKCYYKEYYMDLTHERFILTNQIGIEIGRGLDYENKKGEMRDVNISILSKEQKRKIESKIRMADDLKL